MDVRPDAAQVEQRTSAGPDDPGLEKDLLPPLEGVMKHGRSGMMSGRLVNVPVVMGRANARHTATIAVMVARGVVPLDRKVGESGSHIKRDLGASVRNGAVTEDPEGGRMVIGHVVRAMIDRNVPPCANQG